MIKLIILDIDGVLTDGKKYYGLDGMPFAKTYCDKDFTAIKRFKAADINVCFLSGDQNINEAMAKNRNIDFYCSRGLDKVKFLSNLKIRYNVNNNNILYVGDDLFDLNIMKNIKFPYCPNDAILEIKEICGPDRIIPVNGGYNVISELYKILLQQQLIKYIPVESIMELDKNEIF